MTSPGSFRFFSHAFSKKMTTWWEVRWIYKYTVLNPLVGGISASICYSPKVMGGCNSGSLVLIWILQLACVQGTIITCKCLLNQVVKYRRHLCFSHHGDERNIALKNEGYISSVTRFLFQEWLYILNSVTWLIVIDACMALRLLFRSFVVCAIFFLFFFFFL